MKRRNTRVLSVVAVGAAALTTFNAPAQAIPAEGDREPSLASEGRVDDIGPEDAVYLAPGWSYKLRNVGDEPAFFVYSMAPAPV